MRKTKREMDHLWTPVSQHNQRSSETKVKAKVKSLSRVPLFSTPWTVAYRAPPSMGFSRQEYWSGLPFPSSGELPNPGIKPGSPTLWADALPSEPQGQPQSLPNVSPFMTNRGRCKQRMLPTIPVLQGSSLQP